MQSTGQSNDGKPQRSVISLVLVVVLNSVLLLHQPLTDCLRAGFHLVVIVVNMLRWSMYSNIAVGVCRQQ